MSIIFLLYFFNLLFHIYTGTISFALSTLVLFCQWKSTTSDFSDFTYNHKAFRLNILYNTLQLIKEYQIEQVDIEEDAIEELIALCPEEGVRDLERICRKMCESVISLYYVEGNIIKNIKAENLAKIMGPIYYR